MIEDKHSSSLLGSGYIVLSAVFFASYGVWSWLMAGVFGEFSQAWIRALLLLCFLIPVGIVFKKFVPIQGVDWKWFGLVSLAGGLNQAPYYYGFEHLTIGTATLLFYGSLVLGTYVIGNFFFSEKLTSIKLASLLLAFVGFSIIYTFELNSSQLFPALVTVIAGLMGSAEVVFTKKISNRYSTIQILTAIFVSTFLGNLLLSFVFHEPVPSFSLSSAWLALVAYSLAMLLAIACVIKGFSYLSPSVGGLLGTLEVVFAALFGWVLFGESMSWEMMIGSLVILVAVALPEIANLFSSD